MKMYITQPSALKFVYREISLSIFWWLLYPNEDNDDGVDYKIHPQFVCYKVLMFLSLYTARAMQQYYNTTHAYTRKVNEQNNISILTLKNQNDGKAWTSYTIRHRPYTHKQRSQNILKKENDIFALSKLRYSSEDHKFWWNAKPLRSFIIYYCIIAIIRIGWVDRVGGKLR